MRDRTAMTEPLTIGQQLVARWEGANSGWSEPADLAEAIDAAIATEREECAKEMERREIEVANTIDTKAAYRNAARAIRARTP